MPVMYIFSYMYLYYLCHWDGFKVAAKGCLVNEVEGAECPEVALTQPGHRYVWTGSYFMACFIAASTLLVTIFNICYVAPHLA